MSTNLDNFDFSNEKHLEVLEQTKRIILKTIDKINLDLSNFTVLTEAATGYWRYTPFIAGLANASEVLCYTKDSKYGKASDIMNNIKKLTNHFNLNKTVKVYDQLTEEIIKSADIVTNSGHIRPINKKFIDSMKSTAVISLMWEPWELVGTDVDVQECWKKGISILGVNEGNKTLNVMKNAEELIKKIFEINNISIKNKNIILVGENNATPYLIRSLEINDGKVFCVTKTLGKKFGETFKVIGENLNNNNIESFLKKCDCIVINSYPFKEMIIGGSQGLNIDKLKKLCPEVIVVVYFGHVDYENLKKNGITCYPKLNPGFGRMPWTADLLGPRQIIELNSLGLKVGELLAKYRKSGFGPREAEKKALEHTFCLDFEQKNHPK